MEDVTTILLVITFFVFLGVLIPSPWQWFARRALQKRHDAEIASLEKQHELQLKKIDGENGALRGHLHTKMEIDAQGMAQLKAENEKLKQTVQNLRISNQTLSTAPEQAELRLLRVYDRALKIMERKFPVFIPSWQTVIAHVEKEMQEIDAGAAPLVRRVFRTTGQPAPLPGSSAKLLNHRNADKDEG